MDESVSGEPLDATRFGAARWLSVHDDLLRGLTHSLSNRIGTISAAAYLAEQQPSSLGTTAVTLRAESERLEGLLQLFRLLPRRIDSVAEPVIPSDVVAQAIAVQAHHPELKELPVELVLEGDVQPAYAEPGALALAIVVALGTALRAVGGAGRVQLVISSTTDVVLLTTRAVPDDGRVPRIDALAEHDVAAINWLLGAFGGSGAYRDDGAAVLVPTLQAARRQQRR